MMATVLIAVLVLAAGIFFKPLTKAAQKVYDDKFFGGVHLVRTGPSKGYQVEGAFDLAACDKRGGNFFVHGVGTTCEKPAPDAGKACLFDEECVKNCLYKDKDSKSGTCENFFGDETGWNVCHRPIDKNSRPPQGKVVCEFWLD